VVLDPAVEVGLLEQIIEKLMVDYEKFFSGGIRKEPVELVRQAEGIIRNRVLAQVANPALQFRFNSLTARFNSQKAVWDRRRRQMEEGTSFKAYGLTTLRKEVPPEKPAPRKPKEEERGETRAPQEGFSAVLTGNSLTEKQAMSLYEHYLELRRRCNEPTNTIRFENFRAVLTEQVKKLQGRTNCDSVLVKLDIQGNKSRISAKPFG
jgi:hypothetical protein